MNAAAKPGLLSLVMMELATAALSAQQGFFHESFRCLERAHILAQSSTRLHVLVHFRMLRWAIRQKDAKEILGQLWRIAGAATKTALGLVPAGNTGGANVSAFRSMPVPDDLKRLLDGLSPRRACPCSPSA